MDDLAVVVLAHADARHLARLVGALDDLPIFIHCDAKTEPRVFEQMRGLLSGRATFLPRVRTSRSSWSLVDAELVGLQVAVERTTAAHVAVLSGADYPLLPVHELIEALRPW